MKKKTTKCVDCKEIEAKLLRNNIGWGGIDAMCDRHRREARTIRNPFVGLIWFFPRDGRYAITITKYEERIFKTLRGAIAYAERHIVGDPSIPVKAFPDRGTGHTWAVARTRGTILPKRHDLELDRILRLLD